MGLKELSSYKSLWRGYQYYMQGNVVEIQKTGDQEFDTKVRNKSDHKYEIHLNLKHPRKSTCNCPHADGRRVICKHMVASYFAIYPEEAKKYLDELKRNEKEKEERFQESLRMREERIKDIEKYVNSLSKKELKEIVLEYMIDFELNDDLY